MTDFFLGLPLQESEHLSLQAEFQRLRASYIVELAANIAESESLWAILPPDTWVCTSYTTLHRMAHTLVGSGATFGFSHLSTTARKLEQIFAALIESTLPANEKQRHQITELFADLKQAAFAVSDDRHILSEDVVTKTLPQFVDSSDDSDQQPNVVLVEDDLHLAHDLALQLRYAGYHPHIVAHLDLLPAVIEQVSPAALVVDIVWPEGDLAGIDTIAEIQHQHNSQCPVIFISLRSDIAARLQAVRAGGYAYFSKPIDIVALIDTLDRLTERYAPDPYRILIVDDYPFLARIHATILEQAGMLTRVINEPLKALQQLSDFQPDLILMDMYMPDCNGQELATIIRQQSSFISVPIVFLSVETDRDIQLAVMQEGVDDFLTKPISPAQLLSVVQSRAKRARELRTQMIRDGLTGLLNRAALEAQLEVELARAQRHQTRLAVALIDIDHFKVINDTYGHAAGDRVLKSLARLLQQRLRKSDSIGRYGGEEFSLVLPGIDASAALMLLDELRSSFGEMRHQFGQAERYITFSCGIACATVDSDAKRLLAMADTALYAAKRSGRNRVVLCN